MATQDSKKPKSDQSDQKIIELARERFMLAAEAEADIRKDAVDDLKFASGEQWDAAAKAERLAENRPCLTINRIPQFIRQVTNDQRQNRPKIRVSPVDDKADPDVAKILQGLVRHIEYASNADTAYDTAFDSAARCSFGYFRIVTEFCDPMSFEQDIRVKRVPDRFSVYLDPNATEPDGSDANWGFVFEDLTPEAYKQQYPSSKLASMDDWSSIGDAKTGWVSKDLVRVAEYFVKEYRKATIFRLSDGSVVEGEEAAMEAMLHGLRVVDKRATTIPEIKWYKINSAEVLERTDWPGKWIPIIPVYGEEIIIEGKRQLVSLIRHAKDAQRMYNYWKSAETETIALAPKAPWIVDFKSIEGFEKFWEVANRKNLAYLPYKSGPNTTPPQRNQFEAPVAAITQAAMFAADDLKATTGIYDSALGAKSNESSGIAIQRRNVQAQTSNFHFMDNLSKSIRHAGRIKVDLIPHVYDTARAIRILGEDGKEEVIKINQLFDRNGEQKVIDLGVGKYDVTVDTGPSFETKRQEAVASMSEMARAYPQLMQFAGDLMVGNMDWPGAKEIAERIKKTLPPEFTDDAKKGAQALPPQVQAQMGQMNQMIEQLTAALNDAQDKVDGKILELESKERIEFAKLDVHSQIEMAKLGSAESIVALQEELVHIRERMKLVGWNEPIEGEQEMPPQELPHMQQQPMHAEAEFGAEEYEHDFGTGAEGAEMPLEEEMPTDGFSSGFNPHDVE